MKKEYKTPEAKMVEFDYEENVVASGGTPKDKCGRKQYVDPCGVKQSKYCGRNSNVACRSPF